MKTTKRGWAVKVTVADTIVLECCVVCAGHICTDSDAEREAERLCSLSQHRPPAGGYSISIERIYAWAHQMHRLWHRL